MDHDGMKHCDWPSCSKHGSTIRDVRIDLNNGFLDVHLCREHIRPVTDFISEFPKHKFIRVTGQHPRSRATSFRVTTMDEIERLKRNK